MAIKSNYITELTSNLNLTTAEQLQYERLYREMLIKSRQLEEKLNAIEAKWIVEQDHLLNQLKHKKLSLEKIQADFDDAKSANIDLQIQYDELKVDLKQMNRISEIQKRKIQSLERQLKEKETKTDDLQKSIEILNMEKNNKKQTKDEVLLENAKVLLRCEEVERELERKNIEITDLKVLVRRLQLLDKPLSTSSPNNNNNNNTHRQTPLRTKSIANMINHKDLSVCERCMAEGALCWLHDPEREKSQNIQSKHLSYKNSQLDKENNRKIEEISYSLGI
jgi:hypothetical protein